MILDPIQGYLGSHVDINRANEIRTVLKNISTIAERTGCAIVLIGHLNKASGANSAYRGLGSIDFRAAARSVLLIGRLKNDPTVRVMVHDKSSLAPEGKSLAFALGDEEGFRWLDGYDSISSEELLCGITAETKTAAAEYRSADKGQSWKMRLAIAIDDAMSVAGNREHFIELMEQEADLNLHDSFSSSDFIGTGVLDLVRNLSRIRRPSDDPEERKREQDAQRAADNLAVAISVTVAAASILMEQHGQTVEEQTM